MNPLILQLLSMATSTIAVVFHIIAIKSKNPKEKCEKNKYRQIARGFTILSIILLGSAYMALLVWRASGGHRTREDTLNVIHLLFILLPITVIELVVAELG